MLRCHQSCVARIFEGSAGGERLHNIAPAHDRCSSLTRICNGMTEHEEVRHPEQVTRRQLLQLLGLGGVSTIGAACSAKSNSAKSDPELNKTPPDTQATSVVGAQSRSVPNDRVLVVIELRGGHDGFATLVPYSDDRFRKLRDPIWTDTKSLHLLDDRYGVPKGLAAIAAQLAFVEGVGVSKPDLSHFAMLQRWWQGDPDGNKGNGTGFLGRCCDMIAGDEPVTAVSLGGGSSPSLISRKATTVALPGIELVREFSMDRTEQRRLKGALKALTQSPSTANSAQPPDLMTIARKGLASSLDLGAMIDRIGGRQQPGYPDNDLARSLAMARQLVSLDAGIKVVHIPWGSFDSHTDQVRTHTDHMNRLGSSLRAFAKDIANAGLADRVLVATTSEFGRRPEANASGTDHGTASTMLMMGPLKTGRHGAPVDFRNRDEIGNVKATTSLSNYYGTLAQWIGVDPASVLSASAEPIAALNLRL
jgi:uncharacterized protein (DUF1501 family)